MLHQPAPSFHQPLLETRERPALDPPRQDQSAPEVTQVVRQDAQLQAHLVRPDPMARQPRPGGRLFASFDPLLRRADITSEAPRNEAPTASHAANVPQPNLKSGIKDIVQVPRLSRHPIDATNVCTTYTPSCSEKQGRLALL